MNTSEQTIGSSLYAVDIKIRRYFSNCRVGENLTASQGRVLHFILCPPKKEIFQKDIEAEFGIRSPTATDLLKALEEKGYITRQNSTVDNRLKQILPTQKALSYKKQVTKDVAKMEEKLSAGCTKEELAQFIATLQKMSQNLTDNN